MEPKPAMLPKDGNCGKNGPDRPLLSRLRNPFNFSFFFTFAVSFLTWLILSGKFDSFHLSLGVISCIIVAAITGELLIAPGKNPHLAVQWIQFIRYLPWLLYQILLANFHLLRLTFHPRMMDLIDPRIIKFESRLSQPMAHLIFANSITLTPGTITVFVSAFGTYTVHAIDSFSGDALPGEMEKRVAAIFGESR